MILETKELTKQFNGSGGCSKISLSIEEGEIFCFLGKNGAGKSTFVRTLLGILHPTSGSATLLGRPIGDVAARKRVGYLPELFQFHGWLTGEELLRHHGALYGLPTGTLTCRIPEVLDLVGLQGHGQKTIKHYSKGMKQRLGLASAILHNPAIVFLDEPTSALDPVGRKHVRDIVMHLKAQGTTVFLNTHLLSEVELVADRVGIMDKSRLVECGPLSDLVKAPLQVDLESMTDAIGEVLRTIDPSYKNITAKNITSSTDLMVNCNALQHIELFLNDDTGIPDLVSSLCSAGARIHRINQKENILEEVFLKMVGEEDSR